MSLEPQAFALFEQGVQALDADDFNAAERYFGAIVKSFPRAHEAWHALSVVAVRGGAPEVAAARARQALALDRRNPKYMNALAVAHSELGDFAAAEAEFRRALKIDPVYTEALANLGKVVHKQDRVADALRIFERAFAIDPKYSGLRLHLADLYQLNGKPERAAAVLRETPGGIDAELSVPYVELVADLEGAEGALRWLREGIAAHPEWRVLRHLLAMNALGSSLWEEGWREYQHRSDVYDHARPGHHVGPLPQRLEGKRVLLRSEQGLGDILFFLRFAPHLRDRGARITLEHPPALRAVLESAGFADALIETQATMDPRGFDFAIWLGDLPAAVEAFSPQPPLALRADNALRARMTERLGALGPPPYLGLTWRAGTDQLRGREFGQFARMLSKEIPPAKLGGAVRGWKGTLVALQRNPYPVDVPAVSAAAGAPVHDLSASNADLGEMMALLSLLDDYVTVSNTNVHLGVGLGRTARVLVPRPPDWRWQREDESPWFTGCRVYRQPVSRDWSEPLARLREDLLR